MLISLGFTGIACDVVKGITWVGANVKTATESVISSTQTLYSDFMESESDVPSILGESNVDEDIFFDASDSLVLNGQSIVPVEIEENMLIAGEVFHSFTE